MRAGTLKIRCERGRRQRVCLLVCSAAATLLWGCASAAGPAAPSGVATGLDVLLRDNARVLAGRRVGLITNHTGMDRNGSSGIQLLHAHPNVRLVALFGPEHSITGHVDAGERVVDGRDEKTGLPVYSLYGGTRRPTAEMMRNIDVLVFDIQDIGTRYYTYIWTMTLAMQSAAEFDREFVVLDRPNPVGGRLVQGNVLDTAFATFVGLYPVPMRHGMTVGEMARYVNEEFDIGARLTVVPVDGWRRDMLFDETNLPWVRPSPNMPSLESALHYPGTCLFEGTNLSVGRGTEIAYQQIGAPWLNAPAIVERLQRYGLPGVRFEAVTFTPRSPADNKYDGQTIPGIRFITTDREVYDPTRAGVAAVIEIHREHGDTLTFRVSHFDRLAGTRAVREGVLAGESLATITASWDAQLARFNAIRERYLIYP